MKAEELNTKKEIIEAALKLPNTSLHAFEERIDKRLLINKKVLSLGFSERDIVLMKMKRSKRERNKSNAFLAVKADKYNRALLGFDFSYCTHAERVNFLNALKMLKYYKETEDSFGIHYPSENGRGWVIRISNERKKYYIDDPILVDFLHKKYNSSYFKGVLMKSYYLGVEKIYYNVEDFLSDFKPEFPTKYLFLRVKQEFRKEKGRIFFKIKGENFREFHFKRIE